MRAISIVIVFASLSFGALGQTTSFSIDTLGTLDAFSKVPGCCYNGIKYVLRLNKENSTDSSDVTIKSYSIYAYTDAYIYSKLDSMFLMVIYTQSHKPDAKIVIQNLFIDEGQIVNKINKFIASVKKYNHNPCYGKAHGTTDPQTGELPKNSPIGYWFYRFDYMPQKGMKPKYIERQKISFEDTTSCSKPKQMKKERSDFNMLIETLNNFLAEKRLPLIE